MGSKNTYLQYCLPFLIRHPFHSWFSKAFLDVVVIFLLGLLDLLVALRNIFRCDTIILRNLRGGRNPYPECNNKYMHVYLPCNAWEDKTMLQILNLCSKYCKLTKFSDIISLGESLPSKIIWDEFALACFSLNLSSASSKQVAQPFPPPPTLHPQVAFSIFLFHATILLSWSILNSLRFFLPVLAKKKREKYS